LVDGRWFRTLTVLDIYTRESLALVADRSLTGVKVAAALTPIVRRRGAPTAITVDNGGEFVSRAMDAWAYAHDVRLDFIRLELIRFGGHLPKGGYDVRNGRDAQPTVPSAIRG
jgi:putative transposase